MPFLSPLTVVRRFARALDRSDFAAAGRFLSPDCRYVFKEATLIGPDDILGSYAENDAWARRELDRVEYRSRVSPQADGTYAVLFIDRIARHGSCHEYRSRQEITLDERGTIAQIVHRELPGEREKLDAFLAGCGIRR